jgi:hypothetical protein
MSTITTATEDVPAGDYNPNPVHSTFGAEVKHNGVSTFRGQFEQVVAKLRDRVLTGIAKVESVNTALADLKSQLVTPEFFNAEQTPAISFRSTELLARARSTRTRLPDRPAGREHPGSGAGSGRRRRPGRHVRAVSPAAGSYRRRRARLSRGRPMDPGAARHRRVRPVAPHPAPGGQPAAMCAPLVEPIAPAQESALGG